MSHEERSAILEEIALLDELIPRAKEERDLQKLLEFHEKDLFLKKKLGRRDLVQESMLNLVEACNFVATSMLQVSPNTYAR